MYYTIYYAMYNTALLLKFFHLMCPASTYYSGGVAVVGLASSVACPRENKQSEANKQTWPG